MEGLKYVPYIALLLAISGVILGAGVISLSKFGDTVTKCYNSSWTYDTTTGYCLNATVDYLGYQGPENSNMTEEFYAISQSVEAESDVAEQLPTIAIIGVMVVIISIIAGVFVFMRYFR